MSDAIAQWQQGGISPEVALARMLLAGMAPQAVLARAEAAGGALRAAARAHAPSLPRLARMLRNARIDHAAASPQSIAAMFDAAAAAAPEAGAALHTLGSPALLARATEEIVAFLEDQRVLRGDVLDLGCGTARIAAAIAHRVRFVLGIDISAGMLAIARVQSRATNVSFIQTAGQGLDFITDSCCDLVLAVDCFPYLVMAGEHVAAHHVAEAARVLRPGGALVVLNLSYRNDDERDARDFAAWAHTFDVRLRTARPFRLWDGTATIAVKSKP